MLTPKNKLLKLLNTYFGVPFTSKARSDAEYEIKSVLKANGYGDDDESLNRAFLNLLAYFAE